MRPGEGDVADEPEREVEDERMLMLDVCASDSVSGAFAGLNSRIVRSEEPVRIWEQWR
jgi:hypothetical protein